MKAVLFITLFFISNACVHEDEGLTDFRGESSQKGSVFTEDSSLASSPSEVIVETEKDLKEILLANKMKNSKAFSELKSYLFSLEDCHQYLMDPRLDGSSETIDLPKFDLLVINADKREEIFVDQAGKIKLKTTEKLIKALEIEKSKNKLLEERKDVLQKVLKRCKAQLSAARVSKGLPAEKYPALLKRTPSGGIVIIRKAEKNLDDAFEIKDMIKP